MSDSTDHYDLIIIGGGPAGVIGATTATGAKKKTAVIDCYHELGGIGSISPQRDAGWSYDHQLENKAH